jgi:LTXXQ motif family protein
MTAHQDRQAMSSTATGSSTVSSPATGRVKRWLFGTGLVALGALGLYTAQAFAQRGYGPEGFGPGWRMHNHGMPGPGGMMGQGGWREGRGPGAMRGERFARFCSEDTARWQPVARLFIKTDLRLTEQQSQAFDRLADSLLPALEGVKAQACDNFASRAGAAPDRLQHLSGILKKASTAAEEALGPAQAFYATLSDAQKARVDQMLDRRRGMRGMMPL